MNERNIHFVFPKVNAISNEIIFRRVSKRIFQESSELLTKTFTYKET